jgi:hypothetical protein
MPMRDDFCAFILSHGRPDRVHTYKTLMKAGYTGKVYIVIDDEDATAGEYRKRYGDRVLQFCKREYAEKLDEGDNTGKRTSTIYARAAMFDLASQVGCKYFIQLDDDYTSMLYRLDSTGKYNYREFGVNTDQVFEAMVDFANQTECLAIAMSQGGDWIGGGGGLYLKRKAMNSFVCSTDRPWVMIGRMNEDVTTYVVEGRRGKLFFTTTQIQLNQKQTQTNAGGMSDLYLDSGTYVKSFYTVMYAPSCVQIGTLGDPRSKAYRIHHKINWNKAAPKVIRETHRKAYQSAKPE